MSDAVFTWGNFGKAAAAEEVAGLGPEDPAADAAVIGTGVVFALGALWELTHSDTVRVSRTRTPDPCLVGPYGEIEKACKASGGETHHVVPDMVYRLGVRPTDAAGMNSTSDRIPNSPTLNQGMSICLTTGNHRTDEAAVHKTLNPALNVLGSGFDPSGTAPMAAILATSTASLDLVNGVSAKCKAIANAAVAAQVAPILAQPGRTTTALPSPQAVQVLTQGHY
jgi:hypothetical protein